MRILIIRRGALGDVVITIPLLINIRNNFRDSYIEVIGDSNYFQIAYPAYINKITDKDSKVINGLFTEDPLPEKLLNYYNSFDYIIGFLSDKSGLINNHFNKFNVKKFVLKKPFINQNGVHVVRYTNSTLIDLNISDLNINVDNDIDPKIELTSEERSFANNFLCGFNDKGYIISIHPRTYGKKGLNIEKYIELGDWIENVLDAKTLWIIGPAEEDNINLLKIKYGERSLIVQSDIKKLSAVISQSHFYFGCDTGISHLAAALNINVVVLFGPTDPQIWGPRGKCTMIFKTSDLSSFKMKHVKKAISENIADGLKERIIVYLS